MIYPRKCPTCSWKICIRWLLDGMFCICLYNHLDYGVIQIFSFFINYLSKRSSHFLRVKYCSYQLLFYWDLFLLLVLLAFALSTYWQADPLPLCHLGMLLQNHPLEEEMTTLSSILAWKIPWTEDPGGLRSLGSQTIRHDRSIEHKHYICKYSDQYTPLTSKFF